MLPSQNPNQNHFESTVTSFLSFPDLPSLSVSSSFDRVLHNLLYSSTGDNDDDSVQDQLIDRTLQRVSLLLESTKQCFRKRARVHNSISWFLPPDLTIKVFSMLDTRSLMKTMVCCTMFKKCAMDPLSYSHVDLTTTFELDVDDQVLRTLIHRAGKELRSLKIGRVSNQSFSDFLTSSRLNPLSDREITWNLLRSLHIYNIKNLDIYALCAVLSACSKLTDLKIVGMYDSIERVFEIVTRKCVIADLTIQAFVTNCSNFTSLTLMHFTLTDAMARILVSGFRKLKYMNLSHTSGIDGSFLRDMGDSCKNNPLETLILRDCASLKEREVMEFLNSLIVGNFGFIQYIDISNYNGLACDEDERTSEPKLPLEKLKEERSNVTFVAKFPPTSTDFLFGCLTDSSDEE